MGSLKFQITAKSFYQTNPKQVSALYAIAKDFAQLQPQNIVYDLYTGTGTIALSLAHQCRQIIGIESIPEAINAANKNAKLNNIENATFELGDMKFCFNDSFVNKYGKADVVITDPPRDGMHKNVVEQILKIQADRIIYVSCNSATQARDIKLMNQHYKVTDIQPIDMFPQTYHVENIVVLKKIN